MPQVQTNGVTIEYETFGPEDGAPMLLVMGLGCQLTRWPPALIDRLTARGFRVIRFDNRDVGLSTHFHEAGAPNLPEVAGIALSGGTPPAPYTLDDMAADAAGLLDHLGVRRAHLVGVSMGGMIAQSFALAWPDRVLSLTSIMSSTGELHLPQPTPEAAAVMVTPYPNPKDRDAYAAHGVRVWNVIGSPAYPPDPAVVAERVLADLDRAYDPAGFARQLAAIYASGQRGERLKSLDIPTVVLHGDQDPLVPVECGRATAAAIPGAELRIVEGMGHDLPPQLYDVIVDAIVSAAGRATQPA